MSNKLIVYKENIFTRISNFFKNLFFRKKKTTLEEIHEDSIYDKQQKDYFIENILVKENDLSISIMLDTKGPEIRLGEFKNEEEEYKKINEIKKELADLDREKALTKIYKNGKPEEKKTAKELEGQVSEQLKKRGQSYYEQ